MATNYAPPLLSTDPSQNDNSNQLFEQGYIPGDLSWTSGQGSQIGLNAGGFNFSTAGTGTGVGADSNLTALGQIINPVAASTGTGLGAWGTAAGSIIGSYTNASTDTGASVLGGAASGAIAGFTVGGPIGAVVGGILGGLGGLFGSSDKKAQEEKAFKQQLQAAVAPAQQQEANYLQNQGLLQTAIGNYASGYTPGGYKYTNPLLTNKSSQPFTYGQPSKQATLPNFNTGPSNVATGQYVNTANGTPSQNPSALQLAQQQAGATPNATIQALSQQNAMSNPLLGRPTYAQPGYTYQAPVVNTPTMPGYTGNQTTDQQNAQAYQQQYIAALNYQNQQSQVNALNNYGQFYGV